MKKKINKVQELKSSGVEKSTHEVPKFQSSRVPESTLKPLNPVNVEPLKEGWRWVRLGEVCDIHPGQHVLESDYNRERIGVGYLTGPDDFGKIYPSVTKWTERAKAWCEPGDVLVTVKGAGVGKSNLAPSERVAIGRQLMAIRPKPELVDQIFLYHVVITQFSKLQAKALGSTVPGLGRGNIESLEIPLPPLPEQKRIATKIQEFMQEVEHARTACETQLEAAKALPAAYLREVFDSEEAKKWERKRLGKVAKYINGRAFKPEEWKQAGIPIIRIQNLNNPNAPYNYYDLEIEERYKVKNNDLLISWSASLGVYLWTHGDAVLNQHIFKVEEYPELALKNFLCFAIDYVMTEIRKRIHGATMQHITRPEFEAIFIPVPILPVQQRIAAKLKEKMVEVEKLHASIEKQFETINALPQAVLRKAFRGEL